MESWFLGEYECSIDGQRRVAIPKVWRGPCDGKAHFFLLPGRDRSLQLVPADTFRELLSKLRQVSFADATAARAMATVGSMAQEVACDKQGRFALSQRLVSHAELTDRAMMVGSVASVQIWQPARWQAQQMDSDTCLDVIQGIQERPDALTDVLRNAVKNG